MLKIILIVFLVQWIVGFALIMYAVNDDSDLYDEGVEKLYDLFGSYWFSNFFTAVVIVLVSIVVVPAVMVLCIIHFLHREEL